VSDLHYPTAIEKTRKFFRAVLRHYTFRIGDYQNDVVAAKNLLVAQGYQPQQQFESDAQLALHLEADCEYNFVRADGLILELHCSNITYGNDYLVSNMAQPNAFVCA
jgi:hypothetical protein